MTKENTRPLTAPMRIKMLTWVKHPKAAFWRAFCMTGVYGVSDVNGIVTWSFDPFDGTQSRVSLTVDDPETGRAAAQTHHETALLFAFDFAGPAALGAWAKPEPFEWKVKSDTAQAWRAFTLIGVYEVSIAQEVAKWTFTLHGSADVSARGTGHNSDAAREIAETHYARTLLAAAPMNAAVGEKHLIERLYNAALNLENESTGAGEACFEAIRLLTVKDAELAALRDAENPDIENRI